MIRRRCRERISKARMRRYQNCGKSNCRESETEHVTSPVGQYAGGGFVLPPGRLTTEEWPEILAASMKCFTSWREDLLRRARLPPTLKVGAGRSTECRRRSHRARAARLSGHRCGRAAGREASSSCGHPSASRDTGATRASTRKPGICSVLSTLGSPRFRCAGPEGCEGGAGCAGMSSGGGRRPHTGVVTLRRRATGGRRRG
jgi:hypothetical protein